MRICGCEISAQEVRLAVVQLNDEEIPYSIVTAAMVAGVFNTE